MCVAHDTKALKRFFRKGSLPVLGILLGCLVWEAAGRTRVGMRLPAATALAPALEQIGAETLLTHPMTVNGVPAGLTVFGLDQPVALAASRLRQRLALPVEMSPAPGADAGRQMVWRQADRTLTLILLPVRDRQSVCMLIDAPSTDWSDQQNRPVPLPSPDWVLPPQAHLQFSASNDQTQTALTIAESPAAPASAAAWVSDVLRQAGWEPVTGTPDGLQVLFAKPDGAICMLTVTTAGHPDRSRTTMLQKSAQTP